MNLLALNKEIRDKEEDCHRCFKKWLTSTPAIVARGYKEIVEDDQERIKRYLDEWWSRIKGGERDDNL